jgi:hypothetical protein
LDAAGKGFGFTRGMTFPPPGERGAACYYSRNPAALAKIVDRRHIAQFGAPAGAMLPFEAEVVA